MKQIYTSVTGAIYALRCRISTCPSTNQAHFFRKVECITLILLLFGILAPGHQAFARLAAPPPPGDCNNPITGKGVVIDKFTGGLAGLLSTVPDLQNVVDGDLTNYAEIGLTNVTGVGTISLISIKDQNNVYPAGRRTGFVVEITNSLSGLLGADVLNSLEIRTYLNNQLRETASVGGGGPAISLNLLSGAGKKRRLDFLTTLSFDEVELVFTGVANSSLLSAFRIFYAYEEVNGCNYDCATAITTTNFPGTTATTNCELFIVTCLNPGFDPVSDVIDSDTTDFASDAMLLLETNWVDLVIGGADIPAGNDVGFVVEQVGLLGLVGLDVLGGIVITTYNNGVPQETFVANNSLANVGVIGGNLQSISFKTGLAFDRVRITITSVLSLLTTFRIYYGFVRFDDDADDFPNCVDKCAMGNDNFDEDGDGIPDACDTPLCNLDAGLDVNACPSSSTATLSPAGVGQTWMAVPGNPSPAIINNAGQITGLVNEGAYFFVLTEGGCTDTVVVNFITSLASTDCNDPIAGSSTIVDNNPGCILCNNPNAGNVVDGDLSNFVSYGNLLSLSLLGVQTPLISVKDNALTYPAGTRVGYAVSFPGGVLSLGLADAFVLRTYLNDVLVETATTTGNVLGVDAIGSGGGVQRIYFEAAQPFDEIELVIAGGIVSLDLITNINIYYAFTEDAATCPAGSSGSGADECSTELLTDTGLCGMINYERSGIVGTACVGCIVDSLSHIVDNSLTNYARIFLTVGAIGDVNISINTPTTIPAGTEAGYALSIEPGLLGVGALSNFTITTYLNGVQREQFSTSNPLVTVTLLGGATDINLIGFTTSLSYDEVQLTIDASVASASVAGGAIRVYYAYFSRDSDGDGTPDCRDKCCLGPDFLDADGDGVPDACDNPVMAVDDPATTNEDTPIVVDVTNNDDFGSNGPGTMPVQIVTPPANGMAVVNDNGTPNDPSDDTITYTPNANFVGQDSIFYAICDANGDCDTAQVVITVNAVNDSPTAMDDTYSVDQNGMLTGDVTDNDDDPDGPMASVTVVMDPDNGTLVLNPDGTFTYTPDPNYTGPDSFTYSYCDNGTPNLCDTATVTLNVDAIGVSLTARVKLLGALFDVTMGNDMRDDLRILGQLPASEPYASLPGFVHVNGGGGEIVVAPAVLTADNGSNSIVDWVFVELRDPMNAALVVATRSALLQRDGDIVDMDGTSPVLFSQSIAANYHVAVRHRNHLGTMTANAVALSAMPGAVLDFTDTATPLYHANANFDGFEQATVNGEYALWLGNTSVDDRTVFSGQVNDKNVIFNAVDQAPGNILRLQSFILTAYRETDVTLNGRTIFAGQNNDVNPIFNVVDSHPRNLLRLQSFVIPEQLAELP